MTTKEREDDDDEDMEEKSLSGFVSLPLIAHNFHQSFFFFFSLSPALLVRFISFACL
jgi:hypothetical protein